MSSEVPDIVSSRIADIRSLENPNILVRVAAFVLKRSENGFENREFLMGTREKTLKPDTWALPGGYLGLGESLDDCCARVVLGVAGLKVSNFRFLTATNDRMPQGTKHYVTIIMVCERENENQSEVPGPDKWITWQWFKWNQLLTWVKEEQKAREGGDPAEVKLGVLLLNLIRDRPGVSLGTM